MVFNPMQFPALQVGSQTNHCFLSETKDVIRCCIPNSAGCTLGNMECQPQCANWTFQLYLDQPSHTCGENHRYVANYDYAIKNKARGITSKNANQGRQNSKLINMYKSNSRLILR